MGLNVRLIFQQFMICAWLCSSILNSSAHATDHNPPVEIVSISGKIEAISPQNQTVIMMGTPLTLASSHVHPWIINTLSKGKWAEVHFHQHGGKKIVTHLATTFNHDTKHTWSISGIVEKVNPDIHVLSIATINVDYSRLVGTQFNLGSKLRIFGEYEKNIFTAHSLEVAR